MKLLLRILVSLCVATVVQAGPLSGEWIARDGTCKFNDDGTFHFLSASADVSGKYELHDGHVYLLPIMQRRLFISLSYRVEGDTLVMKLPDKTFRFYRNHFI